jgi:hypothetical protein
MMEAARTSEMSVDIYLTTRQYIPEDSEIHTRRRENLISHCRIHLIEVMSVGLLGSIIMWTMKIEAVCFS